MDPIILFWGLTKAHVTLIVLGIMAVVFVTELIPMALTALLGAMTLGVSGVLPPSEVFLGLANSTVVLFAAMFVIGAAMFHTGLAQVVGAVIVKRCGTGEVRLMVGTMAVTALFSSVCSNTGTTAALMPMLLGICVVAKISPSRQMMPMAFAASLGGTMTLVGTPPNVIASGALQAAGYAPFGFFEFMKIGLPLTIAGMIYMVLIGRHFLPKGKTVTDSQLEEAEDSARREASAESHSRTKMLITGLTMLCVIVVMAVNVKALPLELVATFGAIFLVLTGCIKEKQAYRGIDWVTIMLFAGMLTVARALESSGAGKLIAETVVSILGDSPNPLVITAVIFLLASTLAQFMSHTAAAALICPIGLSIATAIHANPYAVLMAAAIGTATGLATPMATPPNTLVLGPGGYQFMDYVKPGIGLILVCFVVSVVLIPILWPFY